MLLNLSKHQQQYDEWGFTVLPVIPPDVAELWAKSLVYAFDVERLGRRIDVQDERGEVGDGIGGRLFYDLIDGVECESIVPTMVDAYRIMPALLSTVTRQDVIVSPYPRSKVCGKRYPAHGGQQGWHFDTNGITVVAYLSTNVDGATRVRPLNGGGIEVDIFPVAGSILLMQGRNVWHRGGTVEAADKVISPWNYYVEGDTERPEGLDEQIYGPPA